MQDRARERSLHAGIARALAGRGQLISAWESRPCGGRRRARRKSWRIAARCCFTVGTEPGCVRIQATWSGETSRSPSPRASHHPRNCPTARPYAARVLAFAIRPRRTRGTAPWPGAPRRRSPAAGRSPPAPEPPSSSRHHLSPADSVVDEILEALIVVHKRMRQHIQPLPRRFFAPSNRTSIRSRFTRIPAGTSSTRCTTRLWSRRAGCASGSKRPPDSGGSGPAGGLRLERHRQPVTNPLGRPRDRVHAVATEPRRHELAIRAAVGAAAGRPARLVLRGARGGARTQPRRTDGMISTDYVPIPSSPTRQAYGYGRVASIPVTMRPPLPG